MAKPEKGKKPSIFEQITGQQGGNQPQFGPNRGTQGPHSQRQGGNVLKIRRSAKGR